MAGAWVSPDNIYLRQEGYVIVVVCLCVC